MGGSAWNLTNDEGVPVAEHLYATLQTNHGPIRLELFPNHAPKTVRNFVELSEGTRDYTDPTTGQKGVGPSRRQPLARVISGFLVQMGDRTGTGRAARANEFGDEFTPSCASTGPTCSRWANAGPGHQRLTVLHHGRPDAAPEQTATTLFGQVATRESEKVVDSIANTATGPGDVRWKMGHRARHDRSGND